MEPENNLDNQSPIPDSAPNLSEYPSGSYQPGAEQLAASATSTDYDPDPTTYEQEPAYDTYDEDIDEPADAETFDPDDDFAHDDTIHWTATGRSSTHRGTTWYILACLAAVVAIAADLLWLKAYTFSVVIVVMLIALFVYLKAPAHEMPYALSGRQGVYVGEKLYHLSDFKSFGVLQNDDYNTLTLIPVKRFATYLIVPFPDEVGEDVVDILGQRLPMVDVKLDIVETVIRRFKI